MQRTTLLAVLALALIAAACGGGGSDPAAPSTPSSATWGDREPVIYSVVVAEVLDDIGTPPSTVYVVDRICAEAGKVEPSELTCDGAIPDSGRQTLVQTLERYAAVEFVTDPTDALEGDTVRDGGLLFWFGPLKDRKSGEVRVGANYANELTDEDALGVNLALEDQNGSWVVTGAAGLGGCPA